MRLFLLLFPLFLFSQNITVNSLIKEYKKKNYAFVCKKGYRLFDQLRKDENLVSMYAFSCLNIDYINRLAVPILILGRSPESRNNRAYFSLILAQKNILISSLFDHKSYYNLHVPTTDHLISKVFNLYFQKKYQKADNGYIMKDPTNSEIRYEMFVQENKGAKTLIVKEYNHGKIIVHKYR